MKTSTQVRTEFEEAGISISEWARQNSFQRELVAQVLSGKLQGKRGQSHRIKVALGMKDGVVVDLARFKPARMGGKAGGKA